MFYENKNVLKDLDSISVRLILGLKTLDFFWFEIFETVSGDSMSVGFFKRKKYTVPTTISAFLFQEVFLHFQNTFLY